MPFNSQNSKKILPAIIALLIAYLISYLMLKGVGAPRAFFHTMMLVYLITLCSASKKVFRYFVLPLTAIYAAYAPIGATFGPLSYDFLIAGLSTDMLEANEFLDQIPYKNYLYSLIIISGLACYRILTNKYDIQYYKNRTFIITALIIMLASQSPLFFIKKLSEAFSDIYTEQKILNSSIQAPSWGESSLSNSQYDNFVLIIGESARRDYHHAYGYPINNTPFMSSSNGILIDGLTSGGSSTVPSLKAMLTLSNKDTWEADYSKTIVGLANSAHIETYWISNQGYLGEFDTPIAAIASSSDKTYFLKYGNYDTLNTSDFELLPKLKKILSDNLSTKKLIIIHLYGSHPNACDRIADYQLINTVTDNYYHYLNCYVSTLHKTDTFIKKTYDLLQDNLKSTNSSFSLLYFSDHGLAHKEINGKIYFSNSKISKFHYNVPLFMTSSDSQTQQKCQSFKSGLNFTNGLGNWMGIHNKNLDPNYSLFDCKDDPDDFGLSHKLQGIEPDYPIDLRGK